MIPFDEFKQRYKECDKSHEAMCDLFETVFNETFSSDEYAAYAVEKLEEWMVTSEKMHPRYFRGIVYLLHGDYELAQKDFDHLVINKFPKNLYLALKFRGIANYALHDAQAVPDFTEWINLWEKDFPDNPQYKAEAYMWRARAYNMLNMMSEAVKDAEKANEMDPENTEINDNLELITGRIRNDKILDELFDGIKTGNIQKIETALNEGFDVNFEKIDSDHATLLHTAVDTNQYEIAKLLISKGADVNANGYFGSTPVFSACNKGNFKMIKLLYENGADMYRHESYDGWSPIGVIKYKNDKELIKKLEELGIDFSDAEKGIV